MKSRARVLVYSGNDMVKRFAVGPDDLEMLGQALVGGLHLETPSRRGVLTKF